MVAKEQALELAPSVARPGGNALLIGPNNEPQGWVTIESAISAGHAFVVEVDDDVLALDADSEVKGQYVEKLLSSEMRTSSLYPVVIASGRPGHRHLFARIEDRRLKTEFATRAREQKIDVRFTLRPPLAPHRQDLPVALIEPATVIEVLQALRPTRPQRQAKRAISVAMSKLLREGDSQARYRSRSESDMAIAIAFVNAGLSEDDLFRAC